MSENSYPFPSKTSMYWLDPATCSYDEAVKLFEAQNEDDKKHRKSPSTTRKLSQQAPKEEYPYPFPAKTSVFWVANTCSFDEAVRLFEAQSEEDIKRKNNPIDSQSTVTFREKQAAQHAELNILRLSSNPYPLTSLAMHQKQ